MPKEFDASLNSLIDAHLGDWGRWLGDRLACGRGPIQALDTDLSTTLQADCLIRLETPEPVIIHLELESSGRSNIAHELLRYNMAAWGTLELTVHSVVLLLRPKANALDLTGELELVHPNGQPYIRFHYTVVRLWEESYESLLNSGAGLLPLALLTNEAADDMQRAFEQLTARLDSMQLPAKMREELVGTTFVLSGLRYNRKELLTLFQRLSMTLKESSTYQWIWEQGEQQGLQTGKLEELRRILIRLGTRKFGAPSSEIVDTLSNENNLERLEELTDRLLVAADWPSLLEG